MTDLGWQALTSTAILGTARRAVPASATGVLVRADATPEVRLLDQAALVGAALRASHEPERRIAPSVAPPDEAREPTPRQSQLLALSLFQSPAGARFRTALLVQWCEHAASAGVHAPAALLPDLLERATADHALRFALRPVLDHRGRWLATRNPVWEWALAPDDYNRGPGLTHHPTPDADWAHLPNAQRPAHLGALRAIDPATARDLLAGTWTTESAQDRAALLAALATGLSLDDEELLELALDDPSAGVRNQASALLTRLPGSARAGRMRQRLAPLVTLRGLVHKAFTVELPDDPDPAAVRDGLGKAPGGRSQRAWWLRELIIGTPLSFWSETVGAEPTVVAFRVDQDEVLRGLVAAAASQQDPVWAAALVARAQHAEMAALLEVLPDPEREQLALRMLPTLHASLLRRILVAIPSFTPHLSQQLVTAMRDASPRFILLDQDLATRLHPDCQPELLALARRTDLGSNEHRAVTDLIQLISVQQSISEAFS